MVLADFVKKLDDDDTDDTVSALVDAGLATNIIHFLNESCCNGHGVTDAIDILEGVAAASKELLWAVLDAGVMATISSRPGENKVLRDEWEYFLYHSVTSHCHEDSCRK